MKEQAVVFIRDEGMRRKQHVFVATIRVKEEDLYVASRFAERGRVPEAREALQKGIVKLIEDYLRMISDLIGGMSASDGSVTVRIKPSETSQLPIQGLEMGSTK